MKCIQYSDMQCSAVQVVGTTPCSGTVHLQYIETLFVSSTMASLRELLIKKMQLNYGLLPKQV